MTDGIERGEPIEGNERTRESEIQANINFWKDLSVEVDEADVRTKIEELPEVEGFNFYLYIPRGIKTSEIWEKMGERFAITQGRFKKFDDLDAIESIRSNTGDSYAIACRYQQEPDENSLNENSKSVWDWEKTGIQFMSISERMIAELRWHKENGTHLDAKEGHMTLCIGSHKPHQPENIKVSCLNYDSGSGKVYLHSYPPDYAHFPLGVRRVITKNTKV